VTLGLPFALALLVYAAASPSGGNSFGDVSGGACVLCLVTVGLVLATAVPRIALGRALDYRPVEQDWVWRKRQRTALWQGIKVAIAGVAALGLVIWANHSFASSTPVHYGVTVTLPAGIESLTVRVARPEPGGCPTDGTVVIGYQGTGAPTVEVGGRPRRPVRASAHSRAYHVPLRSERSTYSCYYDFPTLIAASGAVPVQLLVAANGEASDSTPPPTRYENGYWGWQCQAVHGRTGCAVLAVLNADPADAASSLALLVAGGGFAAVISLLVSVLLALWRVWTDDLKSMGRMLKKFAAELWGEFRRGSDAVPPPDPDSDSDD
jgi:hypothetical protein